MCFHVATPKKTDLAKVLPAEVQIQDYTPHYHTTGFSHPQLPVLKIEEPHIVQPLSWGLIPGWVRSEADAAEIANKTLNARAETIFTTPMFRNYANNRCLIFVEGFFEWKHVGKEKVPHFIYMPEHTPFALGGIHTTWHNPNSNEVIPGCSIITTEADELMATIHNSKKRMPLVLSEGKWSKWLDPQSTRWDIQELMKPYDEGKLIAQEISKLITSRSHDSNVPEVQNKIEKPPTTLF